MQDGKNLYLLPIMMNLNKNSHDSSPAEPISIFQARLSQIRFTRYGSTGLLNVSYRTLAALSDFQNLNAEFFDIFVKGVEQLINSKKCKNIYLLYENLTRCLPNKARPRAVCAWPRACLPGLFVLSYTCHPRARTPP